MSDSSLVSGSDVPGGRFFGRWADGAPVGDVVPFYDNGTYHLFCLTPPAGTLHFPERLRTTWRHLRSTDLVHWERLPDALAPGGDGDPDSDGIWTGSVLRTDSGYVIFYTGYAHGREITQSVCRATSPDGITWTKDPLNPVSVPELDRFYAQDWRDPFVFWNEDELCYWMLLSTRAISDSTVSRGAVAVRTSVDLESWSTTEVLYRTLLTHCPECPEIFRLGDKWVMAYSRFTDRKGTVYRYADDPRGPWHAFPLDRLDGANWYAAKSLTDDAGRRIAFGWIPDRNPAPTPKTGSWLWAGDLGVPRELVLEERNLRMRIVDDGCVAPVADLKYLPSHVSGDWKISSPGSFDVDAPGHFAYCTLDPEEGADQYVLSVTLANALDAAIVGVAVQTNDAFDEGLAILYYSGESRVSLVELGSSPSLSNNPGESEMATSDYSPVLEARLAEPVVGGLSIRVVVRNDMVEAFVGHATPLTYRLPAAKRGKIALLTHDGSASFVDVGGQVID